MERKHFQDNKTCDLRTIRCATSEDSDHLPMQGRSDFAVLNSASACGDKQACKLQFLERLQTSPFQ